MTQPRLSREQAAIISAYTGFLCGRFNDMQSYVDKKLGRSTMTHEYGDEEFMKEVREKVKPDFIALAFDESMALSALEKEPVWRGIESRPKDGSKYLLFYPDVGIIESRWIDTAKDGWPDSPRFVLLADGKQPLPTHWHPSLPLPSAPPVSVEEKP